MNLLDSNILIYSYQPAFSFLKPLITDPTSRVSLVSKIEVLGFPNLPAGERTYCEYVFKLLPLLELNDAVVDAAIQLRQSRRVKLADSIVAATALVHNAVLYTRNTADFKNIPHLKVVNPIPVV